MSQDELDGYSLKGNTNDNIRNYKKKSVANHWKTILGYIEKYILIFLYWFIEELLIYREGNPYYNFKRSIYSLLYMPIIEKLSMLTCTVWM